MVVRAGKGTASYGDIPDESKTTIAKLTGCTWWRRLNSLIICDATSHSIFKVKLSAKVVITRLAGDGSAGDHEGKASDMPCLDQPGDVELCVSTSFGSFAIIVGRGNDCLKWLKLTGKKDLHHIKKLGIFPVLTSPIAICNGE